MTFNSASTGCNESGGIITCNIGSLAPNTSETSTIAVSVDSTTTGMLTNSASVTGAGADHDTTSATTTVSPAALIPTLTQWGLIALAILISAAIALRFRRQPSMTP